MDRLTTYHEGVAILEDYDSVYSDRGYKRGEAISQLAEYENTELSPSEVAALKAENAELKLALENTLKKLHLAKYPTSTHWLKDTDMFYALEQAKQQLKGDK